MSVPLRIGAFVGLLALVLGLAVGAGRWLGPDEAAVAAPAHGGEHEAGHEDGHGAGHEDEAAAATDVPGGLQVSQDGYTLELGSDRLGEGADQPLAFTVTGPDGEPVTAYDVEHEQELHLIAVRRDLSGFQHVHPERDAAGEWTTSLDLSAGAWRVFADFVPTGGEPLTLGADLAVDGVPTSAQYQPETRTVEVDGYTVTLTGDLVAGELSEVDLTVTRDGRPVTDLQPYLGAYGHLVALREGDLAYLHVHPDGEPGDGTTEPGPVVSFGVEVPSAGGYHLYLDFRHDGVVRTAQLAVPATR